MSTVRRAAKADSITLAVHNTDEVRALLETSPALRTAPRTIGDGGISVTVTTHTHSWPSVVLIDDQVVTTELSFEIRCGAGEPRSRLPRFSMSEETASAIRHHVWTPGIREEHRNSSGRQTHRCACQFGTSWQCGEGQLHHKCIYGRDSAMWQRAIPECTIAWPDGKTAELAGHRAAVWLADRTCRSGCGCDCHADVLSRPPTPMSDEAAAWVRQFVWTQKMRKTYKDVPGATHVCPCQSGPSGHCTAGKHGKCWHTGNEPLVSPEAYICRPNGEVLIFAEPYAHTTESATGPKREQAAMVWLADRACRWRCPCDCHTQSPAAPEPPSAAPEPRIDKPIQLDLFASLTA